MLTNSPSKSAPLSGTCHDRDDGVFGRRCALGSCSGGICSPLRRNGQQARQMRSQILSRGVVKNQRRGQLQACGSFGKDVSWCTRLVTIQAPLEPYVCHLG